jgi:hypothetical protein
VFAREESERPESRYLSLEDPRIRRLVTDLPFAGATQPIFAVELSGVSDKVSGIWSLWRIGMEAADRYMERLLPLFVSDDGRVLAPTARAVWDRLIQVEEGTLRLQGTVVAGSDAEQAHAQCTQYAHEHGRALYQELLALHRDRLSRERRKATHAFDARKREIGRIGLPQVRNYRLEQLERERHTWEGQMAQREMAVPELNSVIVVRVASARRAK